MKYLLNLLLIIAFQLSGEAIHQRFHTPIPGAIIGMALFFIFLVLFKGGPTSLQRTGSHLLKHLPLFFIPAGAGLMAYSHALSEHFLAISLALVIGTLFTLIIMLCLLKWGRS